MKNRGWGEENTMGDSKKTRLDGLPRRDFLRTLALGVGGALIPVRLSAKDPVRTRKVPSTGEELPVVGMGTWQTFDVGSSRTERQELAVILERFTELGGRVVDSSPMYGSAESVLGDLAAELSLRKKLFLATKVWTSGKRAGIEQMNASFQKLRTEKLDLLQVHNLVDVKTHLATLREWKEQGRVRAIGITHYHSGAYDEIERLLRTETLDFLQINLSLQEREAEKRVLPLARDRGVGVIINRPFAEGALFQRVKGKELPRWAGDFDCHSWGQFFLKWILGNPAVTCVIPATSQLKHLEDNMGAGLGRLPDAATRARMVAQLL
jgi:aryl-alcohol dehydrogenase-like predicted oxidoreductase